ncbi:4-amino-4-deoxychorismate lyase [Mariniphaga anaerophila]|uniref:4-amino-4-deoxychorismate lyase n=1 Tax=Mariniphaga anaerophila TaxID=1484053 RepID=A0A1M4ZW07_9BACT|nr:aminotransferase class IV family protein [Mariniphaga anaerophila]SHF22165.1 4-amino-4-deoxychorismate lyase [Mariniphaga anaerophila]
MYQLVETINCNNGRLANISYHQARLNLARKTLFHSNNEINLEASIKISGENKTGLFRCRVVYGETLEKVEFIPHQYRKVKSLKLVTDNQIDYRFKNTDRSRLTALFEQRENCDDILIVKNGYITDSSIANVIFFDGLRWWTPNTPLLRGTQRERLLCEQKIFECPVAVADLHKYKKAGLINAMQDLEHMPEIDIDKIVTF